MIKITVNNYNGKSMFNTLTANYPITGRLRCLPGCQTFKLFLKSEVLKIVAAIYCLCTYAPETLLDERSLIWSDLNRKAKYGSPY